LCDGSEVRISDYSALYSVIGYNYKTPALLIGLSTFALPDLRGRFPLGRDNMDNGLTVPAKDSPTSYINAQPNLSNRVTDITADTLGSGSGLEQRSLNSGLAQYYAVGLPAAGADPSAVPNLGLDNANNSGSGLPNSGGVDSAVLGRPFNTMNPYQTINYIIFTGVI
jgi:microcystin-dependent protein